MAGALKGRQPLDQLQPSPDLGKSIHEGWRNQAPPERVGAIFMQTCDRTDEQMAHSFVLQARANMVAGSSQKTSRSPACARCSLLALSR